MYPQVKSGEGRAYIDLTPTLKGREAIFNSHSAQIMNISKQIKEKTYKTNNIPNEIAQVKSEECRVYIDLTPILGGREAIFD